VPARASALPRGKANQAPGRRSTSPAPRSSSNIVPREEKDSRRPLQRSAPHESRFVRFPRSRERFPSIRSATACARVRRDTSRERSRSSFRAKPDRRRHGGSPSENTRFRAIRRSSQPAGPAMNPAGRLLATRLAPLSNENARGQETPRAFAEPRRLRQTDRAYQQDRGSRVSGGRRRSISHRPVIGRLAAVRASQPGSRQTSGRMAVCSS
jgi:hypothetical protein